MPTPRPWLRTAAALTLCASLTACGSARDAASPGRRHAAPPHHAGPAATVPAARRWVAVGTTGSAVGPQRALVALAGAAPPHRTGDRVLVVSPRRARALFAAVRGARRAGPPAQPVTCADCGAPFAQADGVYVTASATVLRELERLGVDPPPG